MSNLHVEPEAGLRGEGSLAGPAGQLPLLLVDSSVVVELGGDTEGLAAVVATVSPCLGVDTAVVLQGEQVGIGLEAHGAVVDADSMGVLVVEEGAGVAVGAAALITSVQRQMRKYKGGGRRGWEEGEKERKRDISNGGWWFVFAALAKLISSYWLPLFC